MTMLPPFYGTIKWPPERAMHEPETHSLIIVILLAYYLQFIFTFFRHISVFYFSVRLPCRSLFLRNKLNLNKNVCTLKSNRRLSRCCAGIIFGWDWRYPLKGNRYIQFKVNKVKIHFSYV